MWHSPDFLETLASGRSSIVPYVPSPLMGDLGKLFDSLPMEGGPGDQADALRCIANNLFWGKGLQKSNLVRAEGIGVDRRRIAADGRSLAAALHSCDLWARAALETRLASSPDQFDLVFYVMYEKYDEATMPVVTETVSSTSLPAKPSSEVVLPISTIEKQVFFPSTRRRNRAPRRSRSPASIMACW